MRRVERDDAPRAAVASVLETWSAAELGSAGQALLDALRRRDSAA
jgi:hypothetical protein